MVRLNQTQPGRGNQGMLHIFSQSRNSLFKRALFLLVAGVLLLPMDWSADILHYYAVFLAVGALLISSSDRMVLGLGLGSVAISPVLLLLFDYGEGWSSSYHDYLDMWTFSGFIRSLLFNGFHPVFPWLGFFLAGLWIGRKGWLAGKELRFPLLVAAASGILLAEAMSWLLVKWASTGLGLLQWIGYLENKSLPFALGYSMLYFAVVVAFSSLWRKKKWRGDQSNCS
ncbi:DUF418 domain-containing protein [Paenibacillus sp. CAU 1782]